MFVSSSMTTSMRSCSYVLRRAWLRRKCASMLAGHMLSRVAMRIVSAIFSSWPFASFFLS
eukprot:2848730-Amphidinium_carterae.1